MKRIYKSVLCTMALAAVFLWQFTVLRNPTTDRTEVSPNTISVQQYGVAELNIRHNDSGLINVWEGPSISGTFISPNGHHYVASGFYYSKNLWKIRFAPMETGTWRWTVDWRNGRDVQKASGTLEAAKGG